MTNEEKIKEIYNQLKFSTNITPLVNDAIYESAQLMARWKDEQIKQYLLQKKDGLKWRSDHIGKYHDVCTELMDEIIKDLRQ